MALTSKTVSAGGSGAVVPESVLYELVAGYNDLLDKYSAVLTKLDADAGITDTDYESLHGAARKLVLASTGEPNA